MIKTAIGQDSHRFDDEESGKKLILGGVEIPGCVGLKGNSDADVVLHAITNAISGVSGVNILGAVSDKLCLEEGIKDSKVYLQKALDTLEEYKITHVSISLECKRPKITPHIDRIKKHLAELLSITENDIGLTATTGEGLTDFGRGLGIQAFVIITTQKK